MTRWAGCRCLGWQWLPWLTVKPPARVLDQLGLSPRGLAVVAAWLSAVVFLLFVVFPEGLLCSLVRALVVLLVCVVLRGVSGSNDSSASLYLRHLAPLFTDFEFFA